MIRPVCSWSWPRWLTLPVHSSRLQHVRKLDAHGRLRPGDHRHQHQDCQHHHHHHCHRKADICVRSAFCVIGKTTGVITIVWQYFIIPRVFAVIQNIVTLDSLQLKLSFNLRWSSQAPIVNYVRGMTVKKCQFVQAQSINSHNGSISLLKRNLTSLWIDDHQYAATVSNLVLPIDWSVCMS